MYFYNKTVYPQLSHHPYYRGHRVQNAVAIASLKKGHFGTSTGPLLYLPQILLQGCKVYIRTDYWHFC